MKVEKPKMNNIQKIFYILSFVFMIAAFIYLGSKNYQVSQNSLSDAEKFTMEYGISKNNRFVYKNANDILDVMNDGTAVIFMAFKENEWSSYYASILNDVAIKEDIKEIYYYNFLKDRMTNSRVYQNILKGLQKYVVVLDDGSTNIYSPTLIMVKDGEVIYFDNETAVMNGEVTPNSYWTKEKNKLKEDELRKNFKIFKGIVNEEN